MSRLSLVYVTDKYMNELTLSVQDPFQYLVEDHRRISLLIDRLAEENGDIARHREEFFPRLEEGLAVHADVEEQILYPMLEENPRTHDLARRSLEEHQEIRDLLNDLGALAWDDPQWPTLLDALKEALEQHVEEEETGTFPEVREVLDQNQQETLRRQMEDFLKTRVADRE
jgi:hemerythrin superfamily protein